MTLYYGGSRKGAGRKAIGVTKKVSITMPEEEWELIAEAIKNGHASSLSEYFRLMNTGARFEIEPLPVIKHGVKIEIRKHQSQIK